MISWIPDQAITILPNKPAFDIVYFTASDPEDGTFDPTQIENDAIVENKGSNQSFYSKTKIHIDSCSNDGGCPADGTGFKMTLDPPDGNGSATITLKVTDSTGLESATSFTLRKQANSKNPPIVAGIPGETIKTVSLGYGPVQFVIDDLDSSGKNDMEDGNGAPTIKSYKGLSNNQAVVADADIHIDPTLSPRTFVLSALPAGGAGRAVITVTVQDTENFNTDTSFTLTAVEANTPPVFDRHDATVSGTWIEQTDTSPGAYKEYTFKLTDPQTANSANLFVTATSSNTNLVPNDAGQDSSSHLQLIPPTVANQYWKLRIKPLLPLSGLRAPQASTITLSVTDPPEQVGARYRASYTSRLQFLFVLRDPSSSVPMFLRPTGVYNLDPTEEGEHHFDSFVTGEMRRLSWRRVEDSYNSFTWDDLDEIFDSLGDLPLSLNLIEEPCYISESASTVTWCDTSADPAQWECDASTNCNNNFGVKRAVPWDSTLLTARENFLQRLYNRLQLTGNLAKVAIINPNLPGADSGIRNLLNQPFTAVENKPGYTYLPDYSREHLLTAIQHELRTVQDKFPGILIQFGYFRAEDDQDDNPVYGEIPLWKWLYPFLRDEFNGLNRPRVSFFQEDLAATRPSAVPEFIPYTNPATVLPYVLFPDLDQLPSFRYYCDANECDYTADTYNNAIVYQANTIWSAPLLKFDKTVKTINGTPNDAMEGMFNAALNQYSEVYPGDLDHANTTVQNFLWDAQRWQDGLQSWKDYTDHLRNEVLHLEAPAGLTVNRLAVNSNDVSWMPVYSPGGPVTYTVERNSLAAVGWGANWSSVCTTTDNTCHDSTNTSTFLAYAYRVSASNGTNPNSDYAQVAVFLSEATNDGYIAKRGNTNGYEVTANATILAGEGSPNPLRHLKGFLSFNTTKLNNISTNGVQVVGGTLRLKQSTTDDNFGSGASVDIQKGIFGTSASMEGSAAGSEDYDDIDTNTLTGAFKVTPVGIDHWFDANLNTFASRISNSNYTQFRIYLPTGALPNKNVGWYAGDSSTNQPQLILRFKSL